MTAVIVRAFALGVRHNRHDLFGCRRCDIPIPIGIPRFHKLAVVREDHVFAGVSHVELKRGSVFELRQVITREAVSKRTLAKKLARILTDTPIRRSPDCATIGRTACFGHGARFSDQIVR